jgi:hypothetical protein
VSSLVGLGAPYRGVDRRDDSGGQSFWARTYRPRLDDTMDQSAA